MAEAPLAELPAAAAASKPEFLTTDDTDTTDKRGPALFILSVPSVKSVVEPENPGSTDRTLVHSSSGACNSVQPKSIRGTSD